MRKGWGEGSRGYSNKRGNCRVESRAKPTEATTTKRCLGKSTSKGRMKGGKLWWVSSKPWGSCKAWPGKGSSWKDCSRTTSSRNNKTRTTSGGWSTKSHRKRGSWLGLLSNWPGKATWTRTSCFSWSRKSTKKGGSPWPTSRKSRSWSKSSAPAASRLKRRFACYPRNSKGKGGRAWSTRREPRTWKEPSMRRSTSLTSSPGGSLRTSASCRFSRTK